MRRGSPPRRKTPLKRKPLTSKLKPTGPSPGVVDAVYERACWSCECCGIAVGPWRGTEHHIHHRRPRAAGGSRRPDTNLPSNLLLLCPPCHDDIESHRAVAQSQGLLVTQVDDPATTAVLIRRDRWLYLTTDGHYSRTPPKRGEAHA